MQFELQHYCKVVPYRFSTLYDRTFPETRIKKQQIHWLLISWPLCRNGIDSSSIEFGELTHRSISQGRISTTYAISGFSLYRKYKKIIFHLIQCINPTWQRFQTMSPHLTTSGNAQRYLRGRMLLSLTCDVCVSGITRKGTGPIKQAFISNMHS